MTQAHIYSVTTILSLLIARKGAILILRHGGQQKFEN
jgi:hypothetical protein